ncbi:MAG: hypothetical protein JJU46_01700 [Balneolaceae bacterium]|nr:hypothetical protein [Balneolaceae bacterium]
MLLCLASVAPHSFAQSGISGKFQNYNAIQTTPDHELIAARNRFRVQFNRPIDIGGFYAEADIVQRYAQSESVELQLRELYFDWFFDNSDLRIGKQQINWGVANGSFVTGILSPVDLREFLTQDPSDLILGVTAANLTRYFGSSYIQAVLSPTIQQDLIPSSSSRWFPLQTIDAPIPVNFRGEQNSRTVSDIQAALRYAWRSHSSIDLDLMLYYWAHPMPAYALEINLFGPTIFDPPSVNLTETYKTSPMAGLSMQWQFHDNWSLQLEGLYVHNRHFTFLPVSVNRLEAALDDFGSAIDVLQDFEIRDDGYILQKPWIHSMIGLRTEIYGTTIDLQGYLETILNYEDRILPQQYFPYASLLLNRSFLRDRLQMISVSRYNFFAEDFWFQLQGVYELSDGLELALGTNLFGGDEVSPFYGHFSFNQFRENSFLFSRISLFF